MWTIEYKGAYIHGYFDRDECRYTWANCIPRTCKSLHAAKCRITRSLKGKVG